jgi:hypothetical protein
MEPEYSESGKFCPICWGQLQEYATEDGLVYQCLLHGNMKHAIDLPPQFRTGERTIEEVEAYFKQADEQLKEILIVTRGVIGKDALLSCGKVERGVVSRKSLHSSSDRNHTRLILLPFLVPLLFRIFNICYRREKK